MLRVLVSSPRTRITAAPRLDIFEQPGRTAYLIVDSEIFGYPELAKLFRYDLVDAWESVEEMEVALRMPGNALQATISEYNAGAVIGEDPALGKYRDWLKPLNASPYAAFNLSFDRVLYHYHTLGGLRVDRDAAVLLGQRRADSGPLCGGACAAASSTIRRAMAVG